MSYEEIAAKYNGKVKERQSHLAFLKARIDVLKLSRKHFLEIREGYRMTDTPNAERSKMWNHFTYKIMSINKKLSEAEIDYARASIGVYEDELNKKMGL